MTGQVPTTAVEIDTGGPHPARMYDWCPGGEDDHPVDEAMGRQMLELDPLVSAMARVNRAFMHRATAGFTPRESAVATEKHEAAGITLALRSRAELARFFDGLEPVEPGVAIVPDWHPELGEPVGRSGGRVGR